MMGALLLTAGCTAAGGSGGDGPSPARLAAPTISPEEQAIRTARHQAAQYDYDAALTTLAGKEGAAVAAEVAAVRSAKATAVRWPDNATIPHLFYHTLVVDPARSFTAGAEGVGYSQYMATVDEFTAQLEEMHRRGFVLVHPQRIARKGADGVMRYRPIMLPPGKKPVVLSLDDLSYYEYMEGKGFASSLVAKDDGRVLNVYTDAAGRTVEGSYDCVPLLDDFVREHPDFAYRGDKGTIGMTGYNGVLGYRTSVREYGMSAETTRAQASAKRVADAIKANGWRFASHSWGHINFTRSGMGLIRADGERWDREVRPIVGRTDALIYPFGADVADFRPYSQANPKVAYLHGEQGFDYFFGVDATSQHWVQLGESTLRQARVNIDGLSMQRAMDGKRSAVPQFFDSKATVDKHRPLPVPSLGGPRAGG
ncbi:polysaccharide deacetylase [Actinomycetota bacterium]